MASHDLGLRTHFEVLMSDLKSRFASKVLAMGGFVQDQMQKAVTALVDGNSALGQEVVVDDQKVNEMEIAIDEECSRILATRAPTAGDLRVIVTIIKTITDLERIGDESEKIGTSPRASPPWSARRTATAK